MIIYNLSKIKLVLFFWVRQQRLDQQLQEITILVREKKTKFNKNITRWLGTWFNSQLRFTAYVNKRLTKAKIPKIKVKRLNGTHELTLGLVKQIQIAAVPSMALYKAELL